MRKLPFSIYFDNLLMGVNVLHYLKTRGFDSIVTIRNNHLLQSCLLLLLVSTASCHRNLPLFQMKRNCHPREKKVIWMNRFIRWQYDRYRISIRRKTWWWAIFTWMLDASMTNPSHNVAQLEYGRKIANVLESIQSCTKRSWKEVNLSARSHTFPNLARR